MNNLKFYLLFLSFLITTVASIGQTIICKKIYDDLSVEPKYEKGQLVLNKYVYTEIVPIIQGCMIQTGEMVSSLNIFLTIDKTGKVVDATFPQSQITTL